MDSRNVPAGNIQVIDREVFEQHNNVRKDPKCLIPDLEAMLEQFDGSEK